MITIAPAQRFLVRQNLGKLAKMLRFLGYDAAIYNQISFVNFQRIATKDKRIILTRSSQEAKQKSDCRIILIKSEIPQQQILEIGHLLDFDPDKVFSRCSICNKFLYEIDKNKIVSLVPEFVYDNFSGFRICRFCGRIYWQGDHYQALYSKLKNLLEDGLL